MNTTKIETPRALNHDATVWTATRITETENFEILFGRIPAIGEIFHDGSDTNAASASCTRTG